jgi:glycerophosphoryl diester phosphodiesterase
VIAHRGASGHRPEHTALAYRLGYRMGADSVEPDLVATRDGVLICRHDLDLSKTTDIADRPEFADRRSRISINGKVVGGWFTHDFDLAEIRTLQARERWPEKRAGSAKFDGQLGLVTFEELLDICEAESARRGSPLGVHAELKHAHWFESKGLPLGDLVMDVVNARGIDKVSGPLTVMSFEPTVLRRLAASSSLELIQLVDTSGMPHDVSGTTYRRMCSKAGLAKIAEYATGIGPSRQLVFPRDRNDVVDKPTNLVRKAHDRGLDVLVWTLRSENRHLPSNLRHGARPRRHGDAEAEVRMFLDAGVDGLLTDFPDVAVKVVGEIQGQVAL